MGKAKFVIVLALTVGMLLGIGSHQTVAAVPCPKDPVGSCYPANVSSGQGYFTGTVPTKKYYLDQVIHCGFTTDCADPAAKTDVDRVSFVKNAAGKATNVVDKNSFIGVINTSLGRSTQDKTGAQFIIQLMLGGTDRSRPSAADITRVEGASE